jgi:hypothetical protein
MVQVGIRTTTWNAVAQEGDEGVEATTVHLQLNVTAPIINDWTFTIFEGPGAGTYVNDTQKNNRQWFNLTINVTDLSGWSDIRWINVTGWYDEGNDTRYRFYSLEDAELTDTPENRSMCHNDSRPGRNINFKIVMEQRNTGDVFRMVWPEQDGDEMEINISTTPPYYCHNYTYPWLPDNTKFVVFMWWMGPQTRYAPGNGTWLKVNLRDAKDWWRAYNNNYSWNFNITVTDDAEGYIDPVTNRPARPNKVYSCGEFGIYKYTEISTSMGENGVAYASAPHGVWTQSQTFWMREVSNAEYNLTVNVTHDLWKWVGPNPWDYEPDPLKNYSIGSSNIEFRCSNWVGGLPQSRVNTSYDYELEAYNITRDGTINIDYPAGFRNCTKDGGYVGLFRRITEGPPDNGTYQQEQRLVFLVFIPYGTPGGKYRTTIKLSVDIPPRGPD